MAESVEQKLSEQVDYRTRGESHYFAGRFDEAYEWLAKGMAIEHEGRGAAIMRGIAASTRIMQGYPDQALELYRAALRLAQVAEDPLLLAPILVLGNLVHTLRLERDEALRVSEWTQQLCTTHGLVVFQQYAAFSLARHLAMRNTRAAGDHVDVMRECLARLTKLNLGGLRRPLLVPFAEACASHGLAHEAHDAIRESIEAEGIAIYLAEAWRLKAMLVTAREEALECLARSLEIARRQGALWFALRTATDRASIATGRDRTEALRTLREVRMAIREGFRLEDLVRADLVLNGANLAPKA